MPSKARIYYERLTTAERTENAMSFLHAEAAKHGWVRKAG